MRSVTMKGFTTKCIVSQNIHKLSRTLFGSNLGFSRILKTKHFTARFDGVHAFGYNSAESEPIWTKSRALWVHSRGGGGLALADFGRDQRIVAKAGEPGEIVFVRYATHNFTDFPSAVFHEIWTWHVDRCCDESSRNRIFLHFPVTGRFSTKPHKFGFFWTFCDFRPPQLRNDYRSTEICYQIIPL